MGRGQSRRAPRSRSGAFPGGDASGGPTGRSRPRVSSMFPSKPLPIRRPGQVEGTAFRQDAAPASGQWAGGSLRPLAVWLWACLSCLGSRWPYLQPGGIERGANGSLPGASEDPEPARSHVELGLGRESPDGQAVVPDSKPPDGRRLRLPGLTPVPRAGPPAVALDQDVPRTPPSVLGSGRGCPAAPTPLRVSVSLI